LDDDAPMPEVLTDEDREYFEPFECPAELDAYGELRKSSSPIQCAEASEAHKAASKNGTEVGVEALSKAVKIRAERENKHDRANWNNFEGYLKSIRSEISYRVIASTNQAFEIGKLIYEAKNFVSEWGHTSNTENGRVRAKGYFSKWLSDNFPLSRSSALNLVRVYKACLGQEEAVQYFSPSTLYLISAPRFPKKVREYLLENVNTEFKGKRAEIIDVVNKLQSGRMEFGSTEMHEALLKSSKYSVAKHAIKELAGIEKALETRKSALEELQNKSVAEPLLTPEESTQGRAVYKEVIQMVSDLIQQVQNKKKSLEETEGLA